MPTLWTSRRVSASCRPYSLFALLLCLAPLASCDRDGGPHDLEAMSGVDESLADASRAHGRRKGVVVNKDTAFDGYTLFTPLTSKLAYLIDMQGEVVHEWEAELPPGLSVYLRDNGNLLRTARHADSSHGFYAPGAGGFIQEFAPDGTLLWDYSLGEGLLQHHDIEPMPNGNILVLAWEQRSHEEALAAGRHPSKVGRLGLWPDCIFEVKPILPSGGEIVWEWHFWDHLIQDIDPSKGNYGDVAANPGRIDLNADPIAKVITAEERDELRDIGYLGGDDDEDEETARVRARADWTHINGIDYNPELDQIVLSVLMYNELWVIDHSTTTAEAAGSSGGRQGMGGDIIFRWGNPANYRAGDETDRRLFSQHHTQWIDPGLPGAGNILLYNNGWGRPKGRYSSAEELTTPVTSTGSYPLTAGQAFEPKEALRSFNRAGKRRFFSRRISGAQRLPNGHTLVCVGESGHFIELDNDMEVHWEYLSPMTGDFNPTGDDALHTSGSACFRATRLAKDHPGILALMAGKGE